MQQSKCCALPLGDSPLKSRVRESVRHIEILPSHAAAESGSNALLFCRRPRPSAHAGPLRAPYSLLIKGWVEGLEPSISRTTIWRVNQLRHTHHICRQLRSVPSPGGCVHPSMRLCAPAKGALRPRIRCLIQAAHVPVGIRTPDPRLRRPMLYPAELRTRISG